MMTACAARFDPRVEAAMMRTYGIDTLAPGLSPRRVHHLLRLLPAGVWTGEDHPNAWSEEAHLLAGVIDAVQELTWVLVAVNAKRPPKRPKPIPRPGSRKRVSPMGLLDALQGDEGVTVRG